MRTRNLTEALLQLQMTTARFYPLRRKSDVGDQMRAAVTEARHFALCVQLGETDGDPRDLLKLALRHCGEQGIALGDVRDLINAHQESFAGLPTGLAAGGR